MEIKKDSTTSIRKHANELKAHKKTLGTAIKQDLNPDHNPFDYVIWGALENKCYSYPNLGSLKTAIGEEWKKMSEEFILKASKSFGKCVDTIIEKEMVAILSKLTVLCLFYFVYSFLIKINLVL